MRVVNYNGEMLGIMSKTEALELAAKEGLDLIEVSPLASPPVCKIADFAKIRAEIRQKHKESKKKQKTTVIKEAPALSYNIGDNDLMIRIRNIRNWLTQGYKVKILVKFHGREISHLNIGTEQLKRVLDAIADLAKVDAEPKLQGRSLISIVSPSKK